MILTLATFLAGLGLGLLCGRDALHWERTRSAFCREDAAFWERMYQDAQAHHERLFDEVSRPRPLGVPFTEKQRAMLRLVKGGRDA